MWRTEGYDEASSRFSEFCESALKLQKFSESAINKRKFTHFTFLSNVSGANESSFYKTRNIPVCIWFSETSGREEQYVDFTYGLVHCGDRGNTVGKVLCWSLVRFQLVSVDFSTT